MNPYRVSESDFDAAAETPSSESFDDGVGLCAVVFLVGALRVAEALWVGGEFGAEPTFAMLLALVTGREVARGLWSRVRLLR